MRIQRSVLRLGAIALAVTLLAAKAAHGQIPRVRVEDPTLAHLLAVGYGGSPTLQHTVDRLERSDVIVHVIARPFEWSRSAGATQFVTKAGGVRYLRITLTARLSSSAMIGLLGHELQHALEVALDRSVVNSVTFEGLYRRIGHECGAGGLPARYETEGAREAERHVVMEMRTVHHPRVPAAGYRVQGSHRPASHTVPPAARRP